MIVLHARAATPRSLIVTECGERGEEGRSAVAHRATLIVPVVKSFRRAGLFVARQRTSRLSRMDALGHVVLEGATRVFKVVCNTVEKMKRDKA